MVEAQAELARDDLGAEARAGAQAGARGLGLDGLRDVAQAELLDEQRVEAGDRDVPGRHRDRRDAEPRAQRGEGLAELRAVEALRAAERRRRPARACTPASRTIRCAMGSQLPSPGTAACAGAAASRNVSAAISFRRMVWFVGTRAGVLELRCQPWTRQARQPRLKRDTSTVRRNTLTMGRGVATAHVRCERPGGEPAGRVAGRRAPRSR